jgi:hypothetical protein
MRAQAEEKIMSATVFRTARQVCTVDVALEDRTVLQSD